MGNNKYKNGLILGKFCPLHLGHMHLIKSALEQCDNLTVLICSLASESIPGEIRYQWVKDTFPTVNVVHVTKNVPLRLSDLNPSFNTGGDDFFWTTWSNIIMEACKEVDVIFTSETYGNELVSVLNNINHSKINHELVDIARTTYPIAGHEVRRDPQGNWEYIPENVRPYFAKKIAIVGPESVGKSTMAKRLAEHYQTKWAPEYGREYTEKMDMRLDTNEFKFQDITHIAANHLYHEELLLKQSNYLFFADTETITTEIWSEIYFGKCPQWLRELNKHHPYTYDMYFLLDIDVPWVNDGTRHMGDPEQRKWHFERLRDELIRRELPFAIVSGSNYNERFEKIVHGIDYFIFTKNEH